MRILSCSRCVLFQRQMSTRVGTEGGGMNLLWATGYIYNPFKEVGLSATALEGLFAGRFIQDSTLDQHN